MQSNNPDRFNTLMQSLDNKTANKFTQFIFNETDQLISKEIETKRQYE